MLNSRDGIDREWTLKLQKPVVVDGDVSIRFYCFDQSLPPKATVGMNGVIEPGARQITYGPHTGKIFVF